MQELAVEQTEHVQVVTQRKYGLDETSPWWRKAFFRAVYLPFVRFSFKWIGIPAIDTKDASGEFCWHEIEGLFTDEEAAKLVCKGEFWKVTPLPLDAELPGESFQYGGRLYPQASQPRRYARQTFNLTALSDVATLRREIRETAKVLRPS